MGDLVDVLFSGALALIVFVAIGLVLLIGMSGERGQIFRMLLVPLSFAVIMIAIGALLSRQGRQTDQDLERVP